MPKNLTDTNVAIEDLSESPGGGPLRIHPERLEDALTVGVIMGERPRAGAVGVIMGERPSESAVAVIMGERPVAPLWINPERLKEARAAGVIMGERPVDHHPLKAGGLIISEQEGDLLLEHNQLPASAIAALRSRFRS